jgi:hypothetical protein
MMHARGRLTASRIATAIDGLALIHGDVSWPHAFAAAFMLFPQLDPN